MLFERTLKPQIEIRSINADEDVRRLGEQTFLERIPDAGNLAIVPKDLGITAYGQFFEWEPRLETLSVHLRSADSVEPSGWQARLQRCDQVASEQVS